MQFGTKILQAWGKQYKCEKLPNGTVKLVRDQHTTQKTAGVHAKCAKSSVTDQNYADSGLKRKTIPTEQSQQSKGSKEKGEQKEQKGNRENSSGETN